MGMAPEPGDLVFVSQRGSTWFRNPLRTVSASSPSQVGAVLECVASAVRNGQYAAGYLAYEAAPAFDAALVTQAACGEPLAWFGIYDKVVAGDIEESAGKDFSVGSWESLVKADEYTAAITRIRDWIAAGDTYQVNYTFPMVAPFRGDAFAWFQQLCRAQHSDYAAFVDTGHHIILCVSPELFFRLENGCLETRPMKGTLRRGLWSADDAQRAARLAASEKDRAENLMIVDLMRNDMGRISEAGSVMVDRLFDVERYETVWQMTSTISSRTSTDVPGILRALFPSGSVTGAPKVRTMQVIRELEPFPRGIYCGSVGWWSPDGCAQFNVAIRTVVLDVQTGIARYHVGGGITWDSTAAGEYDECCAKAAVLSWNRPPFELFESILYDGGYFLLPEHMRRITASARYFGFACDPAAVESTLLEHAKTFSAQRIPLKVRFFLGQNGAHRMDWEPARPSAPVRVALAAEPVDSCDVFLYHKTTRRGIYDRAKAARPNCDDVILWNERGEITESTTANIVAVLEGQHLTPPVESGLLPGTMREHLLAEGKIREAVLTKEDIRRAEALYLINSVRKHVPVSIMG